MSRRCALSFLGLLLGLAAMMAVAHAQSPPVPAYRSFKDWVVGCDNTRSCIAVGLQPEDGPPGAFVQLERAGADQARVRVRLAFSNEELAPGQPSPLWLDGAPVPGIASSRPVHERDEDFGYSMVSYRVLHTCRGVPEPFWSALWRVEIE